MMVVGLLRQFVSVCIFFVSLYQCFDIIYDGEEEMYERKWLSVCLRLKENE
jgi:hypothetical protein